MPFQPIRTDEPYQGPPKKPKDLDSIMLAGCGAFVGTSLITYVLVVWPHFAFPATHLLSTLALTSGLGIVPATVFGAYVTRRFGVAAAGGFLGGALSTAIFLNLRLKQVLIFEGVDEQPQPEFPASWQYFVPLAWLLLVLVTIGLCLRKEEFADVENDEKTGT